VNCYAGLTLLDVEPQSASDVAMELLLLHQRWHSLWLKLVAWCYNTRMPGYWGGEMIVIPVLYYCCTRGNRARRKRVNMAKWTDSAKKLLKQSHKLRLLAINYTTTHSLLNTAVWFVAPCCLVDNYLRFRGRYCLYHHGDQPWWCRQ
jgi:hypothetical protein